jgi:hypothetical protein
MGLKGDPSGAGVSLQWGDPGDDQSRFMINFRGDDQDALLAALKEEGVEIDPKR